MSHLHSLLMSTMLAGVGYQLADFVKVTSCMWQPWRIGNLMVLKDSQLGEMGVHENMSAFLGRLVLRYIFTQVTCIPPRFSIRPEFHCPSQESPTGQHLSAFYSPPYPLSTHPHCCYSEHLNNVLCVPKSCLYFCFGENKTRQIWIANLYVWVTFMS